MSAGLRRSFRGFDIPEDRVIIDRLLDLEGLTPYEKASAYDMYANTFRFTKQSLPWRVKAVESLPYDGALLENRAESYGNIREYVLAQRDRKRATELNDAFQKNLKAWHLATSQTAGERDGVTAVDLAQQACQITNFKCWYMLETLAAANAEAGNYDEAQKWAKKAMEIAHDKDKTRIAQALRVYRKSQPWRE